MLNAIKNCLCAIKGILTDIFNAVISQPQIEGLILKRYCNEAGETTGFVSVILDEETGQPKPIYFDADSNVTDVKPEGTVCDSGKELLDKFCELKEQCCDADDPQNRDRRCQNWFAGGGEVSNEEGSIEFNTGNGRVELPNPYTEQQLLNAIIADNPGAEFEVIDGMLCRFDGFGGVSIKTTSATDTGEVNGQGNIIYSYSISVSAPLVIFTAGGEPICKDFLRTWDKYSEPTAQILSNILATQSESLSCLNEIKNQNNLMIDAITNLCGKIESIIGDGNTGKGGFEVIQVSGDTVVVQGNATALLGQQINITNTIGEITGTATVTDVSYGEAEGITKFAIKEATADIQVGFTLSRS